MCASLSDRVRSLVIWPDGLGTIPRHDYRFGIILLRSLMSHNIVQVQERCLLNFKLHRSTIF